jgi:hypothetical protein
MAIGFCGKLKMSTCFLLMLEIYGLAAFFGVGAAPVFFSTYSLIF